MAGFTMAKALVGVEWGVHKPSLQVPETWAILSLCLGPALHSSLELP